MPGRTATAAAADAEDLAESSQEPTAQVVMHGACCVSLLKWPRTVLIAKSLAHTAAMARLAPIIATLSPFLAGIFGKEKPTVWCTFSSIFELHLLEQNSKHFQHFCAS